MSPEKAQPSQGNARAPSLRLLARISQYELLSRMWTEKALGDAPPVHARDFAYDHPGPALPQETRDSISEVKSKDFAELLSGPTVDIVVGAAKRRWTIHRNLLCYHAPYFQTEVMDNEAHKSKPAGGQQKFEFLKDDPAGFELFVKWLYQGRLDDASALSDDKKYEHAVACHKLYLFCDKFAMPELKNLAMDQYRTSIFEAGLVPDAEEINEIYKSSPAKSPFRRLMTEIAARQIMDPDSELDTESYRSCFRDSPDFAIELVNAIKMGTGGLLFDDPTENDQGCEYHDHENGAGCRFKPKQTSKSSHVGSSHHPAAVVITRCKATAQTSAAPQRPQSTPSTEEKQLAHLLKALPTTSTGWTHDSNLPAETEQEKDALPRAPPPSPAKATAHAAKQHEGLAALSAMRTMDSIVEAERARNGDPWTARAGGDRPSYVAALRRSQQRGRRRSSGLFDEQ